ncbi:MAG: DUF4373 domain-containing protein [Chloroflexota bacterium]|nr:DUF4373 domain-containing protein [Chloroflexota bacterium]
MKDTFYFSHDCNARNDLKITRLRYKYGMEGVGIYWCLVEMLYEEGGYLMLSDCECIANELRTQCDTLKSIIASDLFQNDDEKYWSNSVLKRLEKQHEKSQKASESATKRWGNANAMRTQCDGNANKVKKSKVKKSKEEEAATAAAETEENSEDLAAISMEYEKNFGLITPMIGETLEEWVDRYPRDWITDAMSEACNSNARSAKYVQRILERWQRDGRGDTQAPRRCPNDAPAWLLEGLT